MPEKKNEEHKPQQQADTRTTTLVHPNSTEKRGGAITRVTVKFDVGFGNALYIRGKGANLNWNKGTLMKNVKPDEWQWEIDLPFNACEFKVLINDREYESGDNHPLIAGSAIQYTPKFNR